MHCIDTLNAVDCRARSLAFFMLITFELLTIYIQNIFSFLLETKCFSVKRYHTFFILFD